AESEKLAGVTVTTIAPAEKSVGVRGTLVAAVGARDRRDEKRSRLRDIGPCRRNTHRGHRKLGRDEAENDRGQRISIAIAGASMQSPEIRSRSTRRWSVPSTNRPRSPGNPSASP